MTSESYTFDEIYDGIKFLGFDGVPREFLEREAYRLRLVVDRSSFNGELHTRTEVVPKEGLYRLGEELGLNGMSRRIPHIIDRLRTLNL